MRKSKHISGTGKSKTLKNRKLEYYKLLRRKGHSHHWAEALAGLK